MNKLKLLVVPFAAFAMLFMAGCDDEENPSATLSTTAVTDISTRSATGGGNITAVSHGEVTERGLVWSENAEPTTSGTKATAGTGDGEFTVEMTDLDNDTEYHVRAYAIAGGDTFYGDEVTFSTLASQELIVNGDFSAPDDEELEDMNSVEAWKTEDNGDNVGRSFDDDEYVSWQSSFGEGFYQTVGTVPTSETHFDISLQGNFDYIYWGETDEKVAVKFSSYSGSDPSTRTVIGETVLLLPFANQYQWLSLTGSFTLTDEQAAAHAGENLVIEFELQNALEAYDYEGFDDMNAWVLLDKISVTKD